MNIGYTRNAVLVLLLLATGEATLSGMREPTGDKPALRHDHVEMVFVRNNALWAKDVSGKETALTHGYIDANPAMSANGRQVVFERSASGKTGARRSPRLWTLDLRSGRKKMLLNAPGGCYCPAFDPKETKLYFDHVWNHGEFGGEPHPLEKWTESIGVLDLENSKWRDLSPLTKSVVEYDERQYPFPKISRDGRWILWSPRPHEGGISHIYRAAKDGRRKSLVVGTRTSPDISYGYYFPVPYDDSRMIAFRTSASEDLSIALIGTNGREIWRKQIEGIVDDCPVAVSTNGTIAFVRRFSGSGSVGTSIWIFSEKASLPQKYVPNATDPAWSPLARR